MFGPMILCRRDPPADFRLDGMTLHQHDVAGLESSEPSTETVPAVDDRRRAGTFFLGWLILAAAMSLSGNVGHALLIAPSETRWLAALAALVPPTILLAATHSATWLVRVRSVGWVYWVALALTTALALGSFALSFDALRSFAVMLGGIRESMAWIWPAVIDAAIAHATLCLLSLTRPKRAKPSHAVQAMPEATLRRLRRTPAAISSRARPSRRSRIDRDLCRRTRFEARQLRRLARRKPAHAQP